LIDATGPRGLLHRAFNLGEEKLERMPETSAIYGHFTNVKPLRVSLDSAEVPPYPIEDAAVHHLFPGGWIWILSFQTMELPAPAPLLKCPQRETMIFQIPPLLGNDSSRAPVRRRNVS